jgi:hypothetical protein
MKIAGSPAAKRALFQELQLLPQALWPRMLSAQQLLGFVQGAAQPAPGGTTPWS